MSLGKSWTFGQLGQPIGMAAARLPDRLRRFKRVRMAFAWVSGDFAIKDILASWAVSGSWDGANKQALIGIRSGWTSPSALVRLMDAGFEVRVPMLTETLDSEYLNSSRLFHPKAICFDSGGGPFTLLIGSANLTDQGMGVEGKENFELASVLLGEPEDIPTNLDFFDSWWGGTWESSEVLTEDLLNEYKRALADLKTKQRRPARGIGKRLRRAIGELRGLSGGEIPDGMPSMENKELKHMWIEVSKSKTSGSGHQIDIPNKLALDFFDVEPNTDFSAMIIFTYEGTEKKNKIDFRNKPKLNKQLRLNLITEGHGGPSSYLDKVLILEEISKNPWKMEISLVEKGSSEHDELIKKSQHLGETLPGKPGSRQWGLF